MTQMRAFGAVTLAVAVLAFGSNAFAQPAAAQANELKIRLAIITGGHGFDTRVFPKLYEGLNDMAVEVRADKNPNAVFDDITDFKYDVIVLYNFNNTLSDTQKQNFVKLLDKGIGLVVWHHAFAAYPDWPEFEQIAGVKFWLKAGERNGAKIAASGARNDVKLKLHIEDTNHPIAKGLSDFELIDEPYIHQTWANDITVVVSTDNAASDRTIAWTRKQGPSRVFGVQLGHDARTWTHADFRRLWAQGIRWAADR